jgi:hypothetical protein
VIVSWIAFPLVLWLICHGCGLLVRSVARVQIDGVLVAPLGFAVVILIGEFASIGASTADLMAPVAVALAVAGFLLSWPLGFGRVDRWAAAAALAVFAVYAAPIVLSGHPTFSGYVKLDDTATWLAITDRIAEHGRDLGGLAPSTYEATLDVNLGSGYPIGAFVPLAMVSKLLGRDPIWLFQPYMALIGLLLAQSLYGLARPLIGRRGLIAAVAFLSAQPALLFGYYLWGGVKEMASAALLAMLAALIPTALEGWRSWRFALPGAIAAAAFIGMLSAGGAALWLAPMLVVAAGAGIALHGLRRTLTAAAVLIGIVALVSAPWLIASGLLPKGSASLADPRTLGNLLGPLNPWQAWGIWPVGDFRHAPSDSVATAALIAVAVAAAAAGIYFIWRRRALAAGIFVAALVLGAITLMAIGSPWIDGKALATASPALVFAATLGAAALITRGLRTEGAIVMVAIALGVLWSNALAYHDVWLAPFDRLSALQSIGDRIAGQGPTLMTDYEPYGVRHLLRNADPEGAAELRRRRVPLRNGSVLHEGQFADIDAYALGGLEVYRTLVLRRSPAASRPPLPFQLVERDRYWEVWQKDGSASPIDHLPAGSGADPTAVLPCREITALAAERGTAQLVASIRRDPVIIPLSTLSLPGGWQLDGPGSAVAYPYRPGTATGSFQVPRSGHYGAWIGGSDHGQSNLQIDGRPIGGETRVLDHVGDYRELGSTHLDAGTHRVALSYDSGGLAPGSGLGPSAIGPIALSTATAAEARLVTVPAVDAGTLCGRRLDWVEAVGG